MAISMNNHESRIKALEKKANSGVIPTIVASNTFGSCLDFGGLLVQCGVFNNSGSFNRTITFPKKFPTKVYSVFSNCWPGPSSSFSTTSWVIKDTGYEANKPHLVTWIAIGY